MGFVIGFILICLLVGSGFRIAEKNKNETIVNKFVNFVADKRNVRIEFQGRSSWANIKCVCIDKTGSSQMLEEKQIYKAGEIGTLLDIAKDIYSKLPQNKYEIIFGYGDNITIKESLEYELANKIQNSERKSDATSLQERLKDIAPKEIDNGRQKYIDDTVNSSYKNIVGIIENTARSTVYSSGAQASATIHFNDPRLLSVRVESMENGGGTFIPMTKQRGKWHVEPTPILLDIVAELEKKCAEEKMKTTVQIEVNAINTFSYAEAPRKLYYPLKNTEINGEWGEGRIEASVAFTALIDY